MSDIENEKNKLTEHDSQKEASFDEAKSNDNEEIINNIISEADEETDDIMVDEESVEYEESVQSEKSDDEEIFAESEHGFVEEEITVSKKKANVFIASIILKLHNTEKKKIVKFTILATLLIVFLILVFTDIIPILPNAYHRSYVGKSFVLGETQNCEYDKIGDNVVYAAPGCVYIFGPDMDVKAKSDGALSAPVLRTNSDYAIVYFKNTGKYAFVTESNITMREIDGKIISAYITSGGYYSIISNAGAGHNMCITVYDANGKYIYEWFTNHNVVDSVVSSSGKQMVASIIETQDSYVESQLIYFDLSKTEPVKEVTIDSNFVFELYSTGGGKFMAIGDKRTDSYTFSGEKIWTVDYSNRNLKTYDISDEGVIGFVFDKYNSSLSESTVELYSTSGNLNGKYTSKINIRNVSVNNDYCLLTLVDSTKLMTNSCKVKKTKNISGNFSNVVLYENYNFGFTTHSGKSEIISVKH